MGRDRGPPFRMGPPWHRHLKPAPNVIGVDFQITRYADEHLRIDNPKGQHRTKLAHPLCLSGPSLDRRDE
jgi:hypothetical protein